ncbi:hypothetical protein [Yersinia ruckeri]|uniref:hypothetical protein n=1 Tax=Yersinia ruckeri TaxID=29486 RepID=UPI001F2AE272|nr:hypothetical protein [Yersinia ruckeri]UIM99590.1 hypothetical protein LGL91_10405 [Yersinia ruckeri]
MNETSELKVEVKKDNEGVNISITPITLTFANQMLVSLGISKGHATFGVDCFSISKAPGEELGWLCISLNDSCPRVLIALNYFLGISEPVGIAY